VSIDLGVWHSRSLIVFRSTSDSSLIFYSSHDVLDGWVLPSLLPGEARHRIIDPAIFVGSIGKQCW
jgi:hypothetical protein